MVFLGFSWISEGFWVSEGSKIMKIRENSAQGGKKRLREQGNKANGASKAPKRGPEMPREKETRAQKGYSIFLEYKGHRWVNGCCNFGALGPPVSILDTKIQRKQNRGN